MSRLIVIFLILTSILIGCNSASYTTVKHVTPVNRNRYYHAKNDRYKKRVKLTKKKILKQSPVTRAKKQSAKKPKSAKERVTVNDTVQYEKDTTGF